MSEQDEEKLEKLREEKLEQLKDEDGDGPDQEALEAQQAQQDAQKQAMLRKHLTDGARKRLNTVRMSKPDFADQAERQILSLAQSGRLGDKIDEEQMKKVLQELTPDSQRFDIKHR